MCCPETEEVVTIYQGWQRASEGWYYYDSFGNKVTGWLQLGNNWYYLDGSNAEYPGLMVTGPKKEINGYTYFFEGGGVMQTGWITQPEGRYYAYAAGNQAYGWQQIGNKWYYFDRSNQEYPGLMVTGCSKVIGGKTYYFDENGAMQTGWLRQPEGWYYMDANGNRMRGWLQLGSNWYYLDGNNTEYPGLMVTGPKKEINGYTYFFEGGGVMQTGWVRLPEGWYYAYPGGNQRTGWLQLGSNWYYLDGNNTEYPGLMVTGPKKEINGYIYFFEGGGVMQTGWVRLPEGWYYAHSGGNQKTGWLQLGSNWYYLDGNNTEYPGLMVTGPKEEINGYTYFFEGGGVMQTGWLFDRAWHYLGNDGAMRSGWQQIDGIWYYFYKQNDVNGGEYGAMAVNTSIDGWKIQADGTAIPDIAEKIDQIKKYLYVPYFYGGTTPSGWDCSGFTQWALQFIGGISIPRTVYQQALAGRYVDVNRMETWLPGDILVYNSGGTYGHVALYLGDGMIMHALNSKYGTLIQSVSYYEQWDSGTSLALVRRYL